MNLEQFWESGECLAIHCDTKEKATKLCKKFDKMGKTRGYGLSYLENNHWFRCGKDTCYSNCGTYSDKQEYLDNDWEVIEFDDLDDFKESK